MESRLDGRAALVTGAASGIGRASARALARAGARICVSDFDAEGAARVAREIVAEGGEACARALDVRSEEAWRDAVHEVVERWGGIDLLIASAGVSHAAPITGMTLAEWHAVLAVNLDGVFLGTREAVRAMRARAAGGAIVIIGSASGLKATPGASAYAASKAAVRMFAKSIALECAPDRIRVNVIQPAGVTTPMWESMPFFAELVREHGEAGAWERLAADTPLRRFATAEDIAAAVLYLCSPHAASITGTDLVIDGGFTA